MKKKYLFTIFAFIFYLNVNCQIKNKPRNPKPGHCYMKWFRYDHKVKWVETDCKLVHLKFFEKTEENILKIKEYQRELIDFGYNLKVTGYPDYDTINAHNKYLPKKGRIIKKKAKLEKRRLKKEKKKLKKQEVIS